ncbi:hypothetical protein RIF29_04151 [Crotalaria pallida]|uniref:Uncharacterized protein n=1 Tax=Crotalaria pallida TaxID=3830 RepID=A0AAN9J0Y3_CROPI
MDGDFVFSATDQLMGDPPMLLQVIKVWGKMDLFNQSPVSSQGGLATVVQEVSGEANVVTPAESQSLREIPVTDKIRECVNGGKNEETADDEALHGDWLVVRRRKKWGSDKSKEIRVEKNKEIPTQSRSNDESNNLIKEGQKDSMGSPHLLAYPSSGGTSRGKHYVNNKKRARKDVQPGTRAKELGKHNSTLGKTPMLHGGGHVRLNNDSNSHRVNSTQPSLKGKPQVSVLGSQKDTIKEVPNKGFDLGTGINISPDLLRGMGSHSKKGVGGKGKPPDSSSTQVGFSASKHGDGSKAVVKVSTEVENVGETVSGMLMDSGQ